jgi:ribonuclease BN (tRNA processing enzyme)
MRLHCWGVRGSVPVPGPDTIEFGGNTTCFSVTLGDHLLILDAGTGVRNVALGDFRVFVLLFSHVHHDHQQGLPFFPAIYFPDRAMHLFAPARMKRPLLEVMRTELFDVPTFPALLSDVKGRMRFDQLRTVDSIRLLQAGDTETASRLFGADWHDLEYYYPALQNLHVKVDAAAPRLENEIGRIDMADNYAHPMNGTLFYRVTEHASGQTLVYATDTEPFRGGNQALVRFAQGADLLVHDSQYTQEQYRGTSPIVQGFGHSDYKSAVEVAAAAGVKRLVLTHFDPRNGDKIVRKMERDARAHAAALDTPLKVVAAREGATIAC